MAEVLLYEYLASLRVSYGWFSIVFAVVCQPSACAAGDQCYAGKNVCAEGQRYKYVGMHQWFEAELALHNARRIANKAWTPAEMAYRTEITPAFIKAYRERYRKTGVPEMLPMSPDINALHPPPPWSPLDPF